MKQEVVVYECDNCHVTTAPAAPFDFPKEWIDLQVHKDGSKSVNYQLCDECLRAVKFALKEVRLLKD